MVEWRKSRVVAMVSVVLFGIIQLTVPISRLGEDENAQRFGWQMFSSYQPSIEFTVNTSDGSQVVDLEEITARFRADLDLEALVPPFICDQVSSAQSVNWNGQTHRC